MNRRAALFLDFDNVFSALMQRDMAAASAFVRDPLRWITWLEDLGASGAGLRARRILIRRCYLNPNARVSVPGEDRPRYFGGFRDAFVHAGFQVVDCPPLTQGGKTSADMVMVMDILDTLAHPTGFEEFIILSSDADFTPVLLRLRAHDRRGIVIATGSAANAYRAAAEVVIGYDEFAADALGLRGPDEPTLRQAILAEVRDALAAAEGPVRPAFVAQQVIRRLGRAVTESDWAGAGGFKALIEEAADPGMVLDPTPPGWLYDPRRHALPGAEPSADERRHRMAALVRRLLGQLGNIPMLSPERLAFVFDQLAARLPVADPNATELRNAVSEAARAAGQEASPGAVNAVLHRLGLGGFDWAAAADAAMPQRLRVTFLGNIRQQMAQQGMTLTREESALLGEWIGLAETEATPVTAAAPDFGPANEATEAAEDEPSPTWPVVSVG